MSEFSDLLGNVHRYLVRYTAFAGKHNELEIQGEDCRVVSDRALNGMEIAEEIASYIQQQDGVPVSQVILHQVGMLAS